MLLATIAFSLSGLVALYSALVAFVFRRRPRGRVVLRDSEFNECRILVVNDGIEPFVIERLDVTAHGMTFEMADGSTVGPSDVAEFFLKRNHPRLKSAKLTNRFGHIVKVAFVTADNR